MSNKQGTEKCECEPTFGGKFMDSSYCPIHFNPPLASPQGDTPEELQKWFEANYLDGDKIQDGQMLSSQTCFGAIIEAIEQERQEIVKAIEKEILLKESDNLQPPAVTDTFKIRVHKAVFQTNNKVANDIISIITQRGTKSAEK